MISMKYFCERTNFNWINKSLSFLSLGNRFQQGLHAIKDNWYLSVSLGTQPMIRRMSIASSGKYILSLLLLMFLALPVFADSDHLILRNGQEFDVKLLQITDEKIIYANSMNSMVLQQEVMSKDVYMVYIEKYGNLYFSADGKRTTGETERAEYKKKDVVYLVQGAEIPADNVLVTTDEIRCTIKSKGFRIPGIIGKSNHEEIVLNKSDVFMIRYRNGMRDIITKIDVPEEVVEKQETVEETPTDSNEQPEYTVVFHSVIKGETLKEIADRFNVTVQQVIEWNELSKYAKSTTQLTEGTQLMIYQRKF